MTKAWVLSHALFKICSDLPAEACTTLGLAAFEHFATTSSLGASAKSRLLRALVLGRIVGAFWHKI